MTVPGEPAAIYVVTSGDTAVGGIGGRELRVTIVDAHANPIPDYAIVVESEHVDVEGTATTNDSGQAVATIKGRFVAGDHEVRFLAGPVSATETVHVHAIEVVPTPTAPLVINTDVPVNLVATSTYPGSLEGAIVTLTSATGRFLDNEVPLLADGTATALFACGPIARRTELYAHVGEDSNVFQGDILPGGRVRLAHPILVGDSATDVTETVTLPDGTAVPFTYYASTPVTVYGEPGESFSVEVGTTSDPAVDAVLQYHLENYSAGGFADSRLGHVATTDGTSADGVGIHLASPQQLHVPRLPVLELTEDVTVTTSATWTTPGQLAAYGTDALVLTVELDRRLKLSARTASGTTELVTAPVEMGVRHRIGFGVRNNHLVLEVDGFEIREPLAESLILGDAPDPADTPDALVVGLDIAVEVHELALYDWSRAQLLTTSGGGIEDGTGVFGPDGTLTFTLSSTGLATASARPPGAQSGTAYAQGGGGEGPCSVRWDSSLSGFDRLLDAASSAKETAWECLRQNEYHQFGVRILDEHGDEIERHIAYQSPLAAMAFSAGASVFIDPRGAAQCVEGFLAGTSDSISGIACDVLGSLIGWGDIRDFALHNAFLVNDLARRDVGLDVLRDAEGRPRYNRQIHILSAVGILGSVAAAAGSLAGGTPGLIIGGVDVSLGLWKLIIKNLIRVGRWVDGVSDVLGDTLRGAMRAGGAIDYGKLVRGIAALAPFLEVGAVLWVYRAELAGLWQAFQDMTPSPADVLEVAKWMHQYAQVAIELPDYVGGASGATALLLGQPGVVYALPNGVVARAHIGKLLDAMNDALTVVGSGGSRGGEALAAAVAELNRIQAGTTATTIPISQLYRNDTLAAFTFVALSDARRGADGVWEVLSGARVQDLAQYAGGGDPSIQQLLPRVRQLAERMDLDSLSAPDLENAQEALQTVFNQLSDRADEARGAAGVIEYMAATWTSTRRLYQAELQSLSQVTILGRVFTNSAHRLDARWIDEADDVIVEVKNWRGVGQFAERIRASLMPVASSADRSSSQLLTTLLHLEAGVLDPQHYRWAFSSRVGTDSADLVRRAQIVFDGDAVQDALEEYLTKGGLEPAQVEQVLRRMRDNLAEIIEVY